MYMYIYIYIYIYIDRERERGVQSVTICTSCYCMLTSQRSLTKNPDSG